VDGIVGTTFSNIEINANDSIYVFAMVTINPNANQLPFVVQDSIKIDYNGNTRFVQLDALGQNARFLRDKRVTSDTTWNNNLPFVILGSLTVDAGKTLTIEKGTKVYFHADAPMIVRGSLNAIGEKNDSTRIQFTGDRLDEYYRDFPGSWPGIYFTETSINNSMKYCIVKNAYQGVIAQNPSTNSVEKLKLNECIFDNIYDVAVGASNSSVSATNCLISNCGYNIFFTAGGNYTINYCTVASYGNNYLQHKNAVLNVSNIVNATTTNSLTANISNSIFYGEGGLVEDEIVLNKQGNTPFVVTFNNVLYKMKSNDPAAANFTGNKLKNIAPNFDSIDNGLRYYNFRLKPISEAINKGNNIGTLIDLDGNNRVVGLPDLGCFEKQ
ncbi:MAG TPA: choice-of-anchor Q domain-containing protein, partial [Chitinophagaceae bacterium]|nr:choice-of-anchor Q domain-containing protein [Chitinophagaceae bacterium]